MLTTGIQLDSEQRQREFVRLLSDRHLAGLGFATGFDHERVPDAIVEEAAVAGFPVFEVPYELPFIALTEKAFTRLVNEQYEVLQRGIAIHKRLERSCSRRAGSTRWCSAAAATGSAVSVLSGRGETIAAKLFGASCPRAALEHVAEEVRRRSRLRPAGVGRRASSRPTIPSSPVARWCCRSPRAARGAQAWLVAAATPAASATSSA